MPKPVPPSFSNPFRKPLEQQVTVYQEALQDKTTWAIINDAGEFWSNDDGWVDQESKTLFYAHEKLIVNLPMGGKWALVGLNNLAFPFAC
jgi:hypothetical protein